MMHVDRVTGRRRVHAFVGGDQLGQRIAAGPSVGHLAPRATGRQRRPVCLGARDPCSDPLIDRPEHAADQIE